LNLSGEGVRRRLESVLTPILYAEVVVDFLKIDGFGDSDLEVFPELTITSYPITITMASVLRAFSRPFLQRSAYFPKPCSFYRLLSTDQSKSLSTCQQIHDVRSRPPTSLSWVQLYTKCPTSFGVGTPDGYCEMIPQDSTLPIQKSAILENVFSHTPNALFPIYYRHTPRDVPVFINSVGFSGLATGKEGEVTVRVTMRLGQNLMGHFKVEDMQNQKVVAIDFDGTLAVYPSQDQLVAV